MTALPLPPALTSPLFLQALYTFLGALADADAASCLKAVADTSTLPRTFSLEEVQYFLDVIREPPSHIDLPDSLLDIANGSGAVSATQPHVQNPSPSRPKSPLALRLCSLSPKPSYLTKLGKAKLKTELERTRVYAWLRASSSDRVLAASAVPRLEDALRTFVSSKLEELNLPCKDVVPCIRTGSAAIPLSSWSWNASWGSTLAPSQPLSRAHEMLQDKAAKVLVLIGPSGMTVNPAAIIPVISHYAERDGLVISIEQAGVPLVVSAREVKEGLELFQTHIMKELAPVDKPYEEQLSACLSSVHSLKVVKLEAAAVPGVELARRMTIAFLCRKAEHLLIWWRWGASFSPDESSDVRRWLGELGEVAQCKGDRAEADDVPKGLAVHPDDLRARLASKWPVPRVLDVPKRLCDRCDAWKLGVLYNGDVLCRNCQYAASKADRAVRQSDGGWGKDAEDEKARKEELVVDAEDMITGKEPVVFAE